MSAVFSSAYAFVIMSNEIFILLDDTHTLHREREREEKRREREREREEKRREEKRREEKRREKREENDVSIISAKIYEDLALEAWTQSEPTIGFAGRKERVCVSVCVCLLN